MINDKCQGFSLIEVLVVISLMALLAVYLGAKTGEVVGEDKFYKTCYMMEEIKEAIIGKPGHYCNGVRQFTGYISDMGNLPNLYYYDKKDKLMQKVTRIESGRIEAIEGEGPDGLAEALKQGLRPQPKALWSKGIGDLPEWKYHEEAQLWAGWRGPYIDPPPSGVLRDAWGNKFLFVIGEVVGHKSEEDEKGRTYRCKKTYVSRCKQLGKPGTPDGNKYWEVIDEDEAMNFRTWLDLGTAIVKDTDGNELEDYDIPESLQTKQEKFYGAGCLTVISLGADNEPGGEGLDKDIQIVIDPTEYVGEVAGHVGNRQELFADKVCLYYPNYTEEGGDIEERCITESGKMQDNSQLLEYEDPFNKDQYDNPTVVFTGINFRFGAAEAWQNVIEYTCEGNCDLYASNCDCIEWEEDMNSPCVLWDCQSESWMKEVAGCCYDFGGMEACYPGLPLSSNDECILIYQPTQDFCNDPDFSHGYTCSSTNEVCIHAMCLLDISDELYFECECAQHEERYCTEWECDHDIEDGASGCICSPNADLTSFLKDPDPKNTMKMNIPIGIRTVTADSTYYTISVCPGGNWIGTVRGE